MATPPSDPTDVLCMACEDDSCRFQPMKLKRRALNPIDIKIKMSFCGICHTDLHTAAGHLSSLGLRRYPCVPGHELAGIVTEIGSSVTKFKVGDRVGVGCMVDSCGTCANCKNGLEQKCISQIGTYNALDKSGRAASFPKGTHTLGGYTDVMVVQQSFAIRIPENYPLECAGPVMCAGVTLYSPLANYGADKKPGTRVAVIAIGGLGIMGIKLAKAMGCTVLAVSGSASKEALAAQCGADAFITSADLLKSKHVGGYDLVLNTIPVEHDYSLFSKLLDMKNGQCKHVILGLNTALVAGFITEAIACNSCIVGSGIGSIAETQAVIDLCARHDIRPEIKVIGVEGINEAYAELDSNNSSGVRHVIDIANTLNESAFEKCKDVPAPKITPYAGMSGASICGAILKMLCCCRCCRC